MATGYTIAGGADLDTLFKARVSAAGADVNYRNASAVDLAQLFEPRGSTTARADVGYKNSAGTDLAQVFMDISASTFAGVFTAGNATGTVGWYDGTNTGSPYGAFVSGTQVVSPNNNVVGIDRNTGLGFVTVQLRQTLSSARPVDADTTWQKVDITGVFSDSAGATVTRTLTRASSGGALNSGSWGRSWTFGLSTLQLIAGNNYGFTFTHT